MGVVLAISKHTVEATELPGAQTIVQYQGACSSLRTLELLLRTVLI